MLALALAVLVSLGLSGLGPLDLRSREARQDLAAALDHHASAPAVRVTGAFSRDGHRYQVDVTIDRAGDSQGVVARDGARADARYTAGHAYALAGADFWAREGRLAGFLAGRWVTSADLLSDLTTASLRRSLSLLDGARPGVTFARLGPAARVRGVAAVALRDARGDLYVSDGAPRRFVRLVSSPSYRTADGVTDVDVDLEYPAAAAVQAPSPVVDTDDPATLPAQYAAGQSGPQYGRDCASGAACTVSVGVVNERGPQVAAASVEVHLVEDDGSDLGTCTAPIAPVAHQGSETVSCTVSGPAWAAFTRVGGRYRAQVTVHNPLYDG